MNDIPLKIRSMTKGDLTLTLEWAQAEGWNPGKNDVEPFFAADPEGYFMGFLGDEPIGTISAVRYGSSYSFVGLFMVRPEHRGGHYGGLLARYVTRRLAGRVVGLDGVVAMQASYRRAGFTFVHRNFRFQSLNRENLITTQSGLTTTIDSVPLDVFHKYDRICFGEEREAFLDSWIKQPGTICAATMKGETLTGYGVIRPCHVGYKIGPLFADSADSAHAIFNDLCLQVPNDQPVFLDVPETNKEALAIVEKYNMTKQFETARMYSGGEPKFDLGRVFGITTFELG